MIHIISVRNSREDPLAAVIRKSSSGPVIWYDSESGQAAEICSRIRSDWSKLLQKCRRTLSIPHDSTAQSNFQLNGVSAETLIVQRPPCLLSDQLHCIPGFEDEPIRQRVPVMIPPVGLWQPGRIGHTLDAEWRGV